MKNENVCVTHGIPCPLQWQNMFPGDSGSHAGMPGSSSRGQRSPETFRT